MHALVSFEKKIQNFRKIKKRWKLSESAQNPKILKKIESGIFHNFLFCALFGQFPAFLIFRKF
jgi:hypothetical protein